MINVFVSPHENVGYVWNSNAWLKIRQDFRIVGDFIGSLPKYPRQNTFKGLPLCLLPEEVTLLKEKCLAKLVHCPSLSVRPSAKLKDEFEKQEIIFQDSQRKLYTENKKKEIEQYFDLIVDGKRKKNKNFNSELMDRNTFILNELNKQSVSTCNTFSHISTEDPWIEESEFVETQWTYPHTEEEKLKYEVFKDLWEKNYYITSCTNFGGDFLCYPGDPFKFHALFIIVCKNKDAELTMKNIVTYGRIGTTTKKTVLFASKMFKKDNKPFILYQSLQWEENKEPSNAVSTNLVSR